MADSRSCLRAGGATTAAATGGPDQVFKDHGGRKYETAKDGFFSAPCQRGYLLHKTWDSSYILYIIEVAYTVSHYYV